MRHEGNLMICTVEGLANYLKKNITIHNGEWNKFPECDFCIIDEDDTRTLEEIRGDAESWYGLKVVDGGFDNNDLVIMADYYGGGSTHICVIWDDGFGVDDSIIQDLTKLIIDTLCERDFAKNGTQLLVEFLENKDETEESNQTFTFMIRLGLNQDDPVEIKIHARNENDAYSKVKLLLAESVDIQVTGLQLKSCE